MEGNVRPERDDNFPVDKLPPNEQLTVKEPSKTMVMSVLQHGVIEAVLLGSYRNRVFCMAGNRRIKAVRKAKELIAEDENILAEHSLKNADHLDTIPVKIFKGIRPNDAAVISIVTNEHREDNPLDAYKNLKLLQDSGDWERFSAQVRMNPQKVTKLMKLDKLVEQDMIFKAIADGKIKSMKVVFNLADLPTPRQKFLHGVLKEKGKLIQKDIKAAKTAQAQAVLSALPINDLQTPKTKTKPLYLVMHADGSLGTPSENFTEIHEEALASKGTAYKLEKVG